MKKIEDFYQNVRHDDPIEEQIVEAQRSGIIKSYFLTTLSAMNARRYTDLCLWCDEIWSVHHRCEHSPDYNCRFSFGEDDDGMAFVKVTKEGLKPMKVQHSVHEEEHHTNADNLFGELCASNSSNSCILQEREVLSRVDQVFDEIPVPNTTLNQAQMVRDDLVRETNQSISPKEATIFSAHQVFDEVSEPLLNTNQVDDECTHGLENEETQVNVMRHLGMVKVNKLRDETESDFIEENQHPVAYEMLDELPIPTFITEMVESAKFAKLDQLQRDSNTIYEHSPTSKLDTLDGPYFHDLVIINAHLERFSMLHSSISRSCQPLDQMPKDSNAFYDGNLYSEYPYLQVTTKQFFPFTYIENKVLYWCRKITEFEGFFGSIFSRVFIFKPVLFLHMNSAEIHLHMKYYFEVINEWMPQINYKEIQSWGELLVEFFWPKGFKNTIQLPSIHYTDDYCLCPSTIRHHILMIVTSNNHDHVDMWGIYFRNLNFGWLQVSSSRYGVSHICNDLLCCTLIYHLRVNTNTNWLIGHYQIQTLGQESIEPVLVSHVDVYVRKDVRIRQLHYIIRLTLLVDKTPILNRSHLVHCGCIELLTMKWLDLLRDESFPHRVSKSVFFCNLTLEDKGDFEEVRNDIGLTLQRIMCNLILMTMTFTTFTFDPGRTCDKFRAVFLNGLLRVVSRMGCTTIRIFDPGGTDNVSGCTTIALIVSNGGGIGLGFKFCAMPLFFMPSNGVLRLHLYVQQDLNFTLEYLLVNEERHNTGSTIYSRRKVHLDDTDGVCEGLLPSGRSVNVKRITNIGFLRKGEVCTTFGFTSSFIFYPRGYDNGLWMMDKPQTYHCGSIKQPKVRRYENHQAYVFDPGGSLLTL